GKKHAGPLLVDRHLVRIELEHRKAGAYRLGGQLLEGKAMLERAPARARHQDAIRRPDHEAAGASKQRPTTVPLELQPFFPGMPDDRDVLRMLEVRLANDPALPMR